MTVQQTPPATPTRLLEAARYLFWEKGYNATGISEILQRAQANAGSFYHFYASKEELLLAVLESYLDGLGPAVLEPVFARHSDPIERIFGILEGYRERLTATNCRYGCPLGRLALEIEAENLPAHHLIARNFDAWKEAVRGCLEEARPRLKRGTDLDGLAALVLSTMEGGVMQSRSARTVAPFDFSVAQLRNYFSCLLAAGKKVRQK